MFKQADMLGGMRLRLGLVLCVILAGCSRASPSQSVVFETGDEFGVEIVLGDRSILPTCSGEGFCSNAVTFTGALDEAGQTIDGVVLSPRGSQTVSLDASVDGRVSPSGNWLLLSEPNGFVRLGIDGSRLELSREVTNVEWVANDWLLARVDGEVHLLDTEGALIETIADVPGGARFHDLSQDGARLLFLEAEYPLDADPETSLWVYERSMMSWTQFDHGAGFIQLRSSPGFGPDDTSVVLQLEDSRVTGTDIRLDYRIEIIDLASGEINVVEESTGNALQFFSVAPDGRTVAIRGANMLRVVDVDGGSSSPFVQVGGHVRNAAPTWSWDSQLIEAGPGTLAVVTAGPEPQLSLPVDITPAEFLYGIGALLGAR